MPYRKGSGTERESKEADAETDAYFQLERIGPPLDPQIERAEAILGDFARFWEVEPKAAERRKLIASLFDSVWQEDGQIVAVKPREPFVRYATQTA